MLSCTSGPLPSHESLYSPGESCLPATLTGSLTRTDPLFAANAPLANNRAKDKTNHLEIAETFMPLLVFLSRVTSGNGFRRLACLTFRKNFAFVRRRPKMRHRG